MPTKQVGMQQYVCKVYVRIAKRSPEVWDILRDMWNDQASPYSNHALKLQEHILKSFPFSNAKLEARKPSAVDLRLGIQEAAKMVGSTTKVKRPNLETSELLGSRRRLARTGGKAVHAIPLRPEELADAKVPIAVLLQLRKPLQRDLALFAQEQAVKKGRDEADDEIERLTDGFPQVWDTKGTPKMPDFRRSFKISSSTPGIGVGANQYYTYTVDPARALPLIQEMRGLGIPDVLMLSVKIESLLEMARKSHPGATELFVRRRDDGTIQMKLATSVELYQIDGDGRVVRPIVETAACEQNLQQKRSRQSRLDELIV